jgi:hypothetical protein
MQQTSIKELLEERQRIFDDEFFPLWHETMGDYSGSNSEIIKYYAFNFYLEGRKHNEKR